MTTDPREVDRRCAEVMGWTERPDGRWESRGIEDDEGWVHSVSLKGPNRGT